MIDTLLIKIAKTKIGKKILDKNMQKTAMQNQQLIQDKLYLKNICKEYEILLTRERASHEPIYEKCRVLETNNHIFNISIKDISSLIESLKQREAIIETEYMMHYFK